MLELFAGIGAPKRALNNVGISNVSKAVEYDPMKCKGYNILHGTSIKPIDISEFSAAKYKGKIDLLFSGSPCDSFSIQGKQEGGVKGSGTSSSLLWEAVRITKECMPKVVVWENVKNVRGSKHIDVYNEYLDTMDQLGYTTSYGLLKSYNFGLPQQRERVFTISILGDESFDFGELTKYHKQLPELSSFVNFKKFPKSKSRIENRSYNKSKNYYDLINNSGYYGTQSWRIYTESSPFVGTISKRCAYRVGKHIKDNMFIMRTLTSKESLLLQGFTEYDYIKLRTECSEPNIFAQAGDSISVPILEAIFTELYKKG